VQLVIADTGPVNYLILIAHIEILPLLFEKVILPSAVADELANSGAHLLVRNWIAHPPAWVEIHQTGRHHDNIIKRLLIHAGAFNRST
jgi:predicted nucleic acid-binding protein